MAGIFERLIQIGTVTVVDHDAGKVRVKFPDTGLTSDWLCVLNNAPTVAVTAAEDTDGHRHGTTVFRWMPAVNDTVLVLYLPVFNSDGFVIGGI